MASSQQNPQGSQNIPGSSSSNEERYIEPSRTLLTLIDSLEVLCELIVDFVSMKENGYDLIPDVELQGWTKYFDRLIGHEGGGIRCSDMADKSSDLTKVSKEIFTSGQSSNKIKYLKDYLRIWSKIILECINHRKPTSSPDYINIDQKDRSESRASGVAPQLRF
ncbi:unnamed protein product [Vicia faba]|uniref:Uncharacterized protein n=1 Tax=Vicia faba TaxID=3906 RepID=A0AAV1A070_VICFA|nr:unnamed protein product [Vicia faba]